MKPFCVLRVILSRLQEPEDRIVIGERNGHGSLTLSEMDPEVIVDRLIHIAADRPGPGLLVRSCHRR